MFPIGSKGVVVIPLTPALATDLRLMEQLIRRAEDNGYKESPFRFLHLHDAWWLRGYTLALAAARAVHGDPLCSALKLPPGTGALLPNDNEFEAPPAWIATLPSSVAGAVSELGLEPLHPADFVYLMADPSGRVRCSHDVMPAPPGSAWHEVPATERTPNLCLFPWRRTPRGMNGGEESQPLLLSVLHGASATWAEM